MPDMAKWDRVQMANLKNYEKMPNCVLHRVACILNSLDTRTISVGYNGPPSGLEHCEQVGCNKSNGGKCRGNHAEQNAIQNSAQSPRLCFRGGTAYISIFPCNDCAKALVNLGIARVIFRDNYLRVTCSDGQLTTQIEHHGLSILKEAGITVIQYLEEIDDFAIVYNPHQKKPIIPQSITIHLETADPIFFQIVEKMGLDRQIIPLFNRNMVNQPIILSANMSWDKFEEECSTIEFSDIIVEIGFLEKQLETNNHEEIIKTLCKTVFSAYTKNFFMH